MRAIIKKLIVFFFFGLFFFTIVSESGAKTEEPVVGVVETMEQLQEVISKQPGKPIQVAFPGTGPDSEATTLRGILNMPKGAEKTSPVITLLHGAGGPMASVERTDYWTKKLNTWGYTTLAVDSFGPRGWANGRALGKLSATISLH